MLDRRAVFLVNLVQDVNIVRPLVELAAGELGLKTEILVSRKFVLEDRVGRWLGEIEDLSSATDARIFLFCNARDLTQLLEGKGGVIVAASESSLAPHAVTHEAFHVVPPSFVRITLQHGFEGVGFLHSREHDLAHGREVTFAADLLCGWFGVRHQKSMLPSQRPKLVVTGPTASLLTRPPEADQLRSEIGLVCENLHSVRFTAGDASPQTFLTTFDAFCEAMAENGRGVALRPHPAGQYTVKKGVVLPANAELNNDPIYRVDLRRYAYGISAASSILIDMMLASVPVAIWRDASSSMDVSAYDGLTEVRSVADWIVFAREAVEAPQRFLDLQKNFLERHDMPYARAEVSRRFASVLTASARATAMVTPSARASERILVCVDGDGSRLPELLGRGIGDKIAAGKASLAVLTGQQAPRDLGARAATAPALRTWIDARLEIIDPTVVFLDREGGPYAGHVTAHAHRRGVPIVSYLGQDAESCVPGPLRMPDTPTASAMKLLEASDLVCGSPGRIDRALADPALQGRAAVVLSDWDLRPRRKEPAIAERTSDEIRGKLQSIFVKARNQKRKRRVLLVAPAFLPTLQLSFIKPFALPRARGEIAYDVLTAEEIQATGGETSSVQAERALIADRIRSFAPTVIVLCRYAGPHEDLFLDLARRLGVPLVFHIDDDLLGVPEALGEKKAAIHNAPSRVNAIRALLDRSSLVYCSTPRLKEHFRSIGAKAPLRAAEIYCSGRVITPASLRPVSKVGYMASADHRHNFETILPAVVAFLRRNAEVEFQFFGTIPRPPELAEFGRRVGNARAILDYEKFLEGFAQHEWDVGICPLAPIHFNLMKADTKWVEYTSVGAAVVASRGTVYDACCADACGLLAEGVDEWGEALDSLVASPQARFAQVERAQKRLVEEYSLDRLLDQILDVLDEATANAVSADGFKRREVATAAE